MKLFDFMKICNDLQTINIIKDNDFIFSGPVCDVLLSNVDTMQSIENICICDDSSIDIYLLSDY